MTSPNVKQAAEAIVVGASHDVVHAFTAADAMRGWGKDFRPTEVKAACELLVEQGKMTVSYQDTGCRTYVPFYRRTSKCIPTKRGERS